jgi:hypothetical protein
MFFFFPLIYVQGRERGVERRSGEQEQNRIE